MKNKPLISVIVPIYNVEKYLQKCVDSILNQTYENLEIILVDDGSTDNCPKICDCYQKKDKRIRVIHKENGGLSDARNCGLDIAKGEYIGFVDSDDFIDSNMYSLLINIMKKQCTDLAVCNYLKVDKNYKIISNKNNDLPIKDERINKRTFFLRIVNEKEWYYIVAWNKLYRKDIFDNLRFPIGKIHEDEFLIHHIINKCKFISCINQPLYYYVERNGSIMNTKFNLKRFDYGDALLDRYFFSMNNDLYDLKVDTIKNLSYCLEKWRKLSNNKDYKKKYNRIRKKSKFLIFSRYAWRQYSLKHRMYLKLLLLIPK